TNLDRLRKGCRRSQGTGHPQSPIVPASRCRSVQVSHHRDLHPDVLCVTLKQSRTCFPNSMSFCFKASCSVCTICLPIELQAEQEKYHLVSNFRSRKYKK